jgi:hypothetical protein
VARGSRHVEAGDRDPGGTGAFGEAVPAMIARVQGTVVTLGGNGGLRVERTIAEQTGGIEGAAHRAILQALGKRQPRSSLPEPVRDAPHALCVAMEVGERPTHRPVPRARTQ